MTRSATVLEHTGMAPNPGHEQRITGRTRAQRTIRGILADAPGPCIATIGTFDGMHDGHQAVLRAASSLASDHGMPLVAVTFEPRPELFFRRDALPNLSASIDERIDSLLGAGVAHVCVLPFDADVAALSDVDFVRMLVGALRAEKLVVGDDFRLGRDRTGAPARITALGLPTVGVPLVLRSATEKISSTAMRGARAKGLAR